MKNIANKILFSLATVASTLIITSSCKNIAQEDRLIPIEDITKEGTRTILLEDFTGVICKNCPEAAIAIHDIKQIYGNKVVAVGLHGAENFTSKDTPLFCNDAEAYYKKFAPGMALPAGMINRKVHKGQTTTAIEGYATWAGIISEELKLPQLLQITLQGKAESDEAVTCQVKVEKVEKDGITLPDEMMLQVWVIEDGIIYKQVWGEKTVPDYEHNHVLRGAVNGTWGEPLELGKQYSYTYTLPKVNDIEECSVVAFVYNKATNEVLEAGQAKLTK